MRICFVLPYCPPDPDPEPSAYLDCYPLLRHLPQQVAGLGHAVDVVLQHPRNAVHDEGSVRYHLVAERHLPGALGAALAALSSRERSHMVPALATIARTLSLGPDLVHVHGMVPHINLALAARALARAAIPWVAQHHGGGPARNVLARRLQRRSLARPAALLFTAREHAQPYIDAGLLADDKRIVEVVETSSPYRRGDRTAARLQTGYDGEPVLLSVARMHPVKDPLTVLRAVELLLATLPAAHLHPVYRSDELLADIQQFVRARPALRDHVTFHGRQPPEAMETIYNSADFLLQASQREYSGYAVLEAMSCGVIPVVSDIAAFRAMLGPELSHLLFAPGDAATLAARVQQAWCGNAGAVASRVVDRFEHRLSFKAMAAQLTELYGRLL